jgi:hypothetical protein
MSAPLRITRAAARAADDSQQDGIKNWVDRLIKLIPSEVLAVYLAGKGTAETVPELNRWWPVVCLVLVVIVRIWGTNLPGKGPQFVAVLISSVSFVIWILAIDKDFAGWSPQPQFVTLGVLVWTLLVPIFYRGD